MTANLDKYLSTKEAATLLGIQPNTLEIWRCKGRGPLFVKLGGPVRYRLSDLNAWIEKRIHGSTSSATAARNQDRPRQVEVVSRTPAPNAPWLKENA